MDGVNIVHPMDVTSPLIFCFHRPICQNRVYLVYLFYLKKQGTEFLDPVEIRLTVPPPKIGSF
ncbi:hypothetical protein D3C72_2570350 [compost metagenome]